MAYPFPAGPYAFFPPAADYRLGGSSGGHRRSSRSRSRSRDRHTHSSGSRGKSTQQQLDNRRTGGDSVRTAQTIFVSGIHPKGQTTQQTAAVQWQGGTRTTALSGLEFRALHSVLSLHDCSSLLLSVSVSSPCAFVCVGAQWTTWICFRSSVTPAEWTTFSSSRMRDQARARDSAISR